MEPMLRDALSFNIYKMAEISALATPSPTKQRIKSLLVWPASEYICVRPLSKSRPCRQLVYHNSISNFPCWLFCLRGDTAHTRGVEATYIGTLRHGDATPYNIDHCEIQVYDARKRYASFKRESSDRVSMQSVTRAINRIPLRMRSDRAVVCKVLK